MPVFGPPGRGDRIARRILAPLALVLVLLVGVFWVAFTPVRVEGDSMLPGLHHGDRVLASRSYGVPSRGDIVRVEGFGPPAIAKNRFIKRVVAVPGDSVRVESGRAIVNGSPEPLGSSRIVASGDISDGDSVVPPGHVYVLGDNRPVSLDSRLLGPVPIDAVTGRLVFVFTPVNRLGPVD